jgi:aerotaxis receptor
MNQTNHATPGHEVFFKEDEFIITKTDPYGTITYCNRTFMKVAAISWVDAIGKPHNIIRHPDMPKTAFHNLWQTLKSGNEWFGFVKNKTAEGNYYWVFANVTLDKLGGELIGYYSVRRPAPRDAIKVIEPLYQTLKEIESQQGLDAAIEHLEALLADKETTYRDFILDLYYTTSGHYA